MEAEDDFIRTIDESEDVDVAEESADSDEEVIHGILIMFNI